MQLQQGPLVCTTVARSHITDVLSLALYMTPVVRVLGPEDWTLDKFQLSTMFQVVVRCCHIHGRDMHGLGSAVIQTPLDTLVMVVRSSMQAQHAMPCMLAVLEPLQELLFCELCVELRAQLDTYVAQVDCVDALESAMWQIRFTC
jgi:hypothetical protein